MSPNRTVGVLYRLDRASAERLSGLADVEFMILYYSNYRNISYKLIIIARCHA